VPGTPPNSPNFDIPRPSDADVASFSAQVNPIIDGFDAQAMKKGASGQSLQTLSLTDTGSDGPSLSIANTTNTAMRLNQTGAQLIMANFIAAGDGNAAGGMNGAGGMGWGPGGDTGFDVILTRSAAQTLNLAGYLSIAESLTVVGTLNPEDDINAGGDLNLAGALHVSGNGTINGSATLSGNVYAAQALNLTGAAVLSSTLQVDGASTLEGNVSVGGTLSVAGSASIGATTGNTTLTLDGQTALVAYQYKGATHFTQGVNTTGAWALTDNAGNGGTGQNLMFSLPGSNSINIPNPVELVAAGPVVVGGPLSAQAGLAVTGAITATVGTSVVASASGAGVLATTTINLNPGVYMLYFQATTSNVNEQLLWMFTVASPYQQISYVSLLHTEYANNPSSLSVVFPGSGPNYTPNAGASNNGFNGAADCAQIQLAVPGGGAGIRWTYTINQVAAGIVGG
jgi:cytoskeletal protein CcmA (bactofilin family)